MGARQPLALGRRALLIDLENIAYDGDTPLPVETVEARIARVLAAAGVVDYRIAVAPRSSLRQHLAGLARLGLRWVECQPGADSADAVILDCAKQLAHVGFTHFLVASGDHYFASIAGLGHLGVVVPAGHPVARALQYASETVIAA